ncbi:MAG: peptidoglycan DD-metalloendopeptidase family protein [Gammaproteobacteria bacterium]|nr:peptidoglycan DD-metalloendopeptidase family protein [Gammaproteobacteria bacterium]MCP4881212.1 peptidoglycan DD-metalloendopeptidase family protein [Gammaproteobacteria bacterium]
MKKTFPKQHLIILVIIAVVMVVLLLLSDSQPPPDDTPLVISVPLDIQEPKQPSAQTKSTVVAATPLVEPIIEEDWQSVKVKSGDNLTTIFRRIGLTPQDVYRISKATKKSKALSRLMPGQTLEFIINQGSIEKIRHTISRLEQDLILRNDSGSYDIEKVVREPELRPKFAKATIQNSLFVDGIKAGLSQKKLMELANIFGWDIDFALDIRAGDSFAVLYEEKFLDDRPFGEGHILAAQFINQKRIVNAIRHTDGNYYSDKGYSMRKAFLRSPVDFFRISSKYNPKRLHPILKTVRPHRGVDYAAATGTPIKASGDGKVIWRGTKGGYGRTVIIQHAGIYTTLYAHMSKYNSKVRSGSRVKQGQVIGYIGSSGTATGPHLHYEFRVNGVHKNPLKVKFPNVQPLNKQQLKTFQPLANERLQQLQAYKLGTPE